MRFRVMGPLEVLSPDGWTAIGAAKWRSLLACLLLRPGQLVPTETLIFEVWGDSPPSTANNLVSIYVHRLRKVIGDAEGRVLAYRAPGYLLRVAQGDTDLQVFESLVAEGRSALASADPEDTAAVLARALDLWRGPLFADVPASALITSESQRAEELRLAATELRIESDLACGRSAQVIPELRRLVMENPIREGLWSLLMRALDEAGRHAEALDTYAQARQVISEQLGVEPRAELQRLHARLLAADASPDTRRQRRPEADRESGPWAARDPRPEDPAPSAGRTDDGGQDGAAGEADDVAAAPGEAPGTIGIATFADPGPGAPAPAPIASRSNARETSSEVPVARPAQLPADIGDFTGRESHVTYLCDMLAATEAASSPGAVRIAVVNGAAGLGKTTLAVHAAHRVRALFPDGQLYVDLSGASAHPMAPGEVLARFLRDLGVEGDRVPVGDDERAALFRTTLTGRHMLILLDNARDAAQVRPLLPGSASCAVLVTTRNRTADLASTRFVDLNVLADAEALTLFSRIVGDDRPAAEPDATAEVLLACAGLPLAIRICAARLAARRHWKIATMANRLRDERRRLDELKTGDLAVRASFQVSYDSLQAARYGTDPARAFRLLGLWQGPVISLSAAVALLAEPEADVAYAMETLVDANLLESPAPDSYRFHDLLRFFATERALEEETQQARRAAVRRLLSWYVHMADATAQICSPHRYRIPLEGIEDIELAFPMRTTEDALGWYESERANLIEATRQAARSDMDDIAWQLPVSLFSVFNRRDNWVDCVTTHRIGLECSRRAGNKQGEGLILNNLGYALGKLGEAEAVSHLKQAMIIRRQIGDSTGEARSAVNLGEVYRLLREPQVALEHMERARVTFRRTGDSTVHGAGLVNLGEIYLDLGNLDDAADCFKQAHSIFTAIGASYGKGYALHNIGRISIELGRPGEAIEYLEQALAVHRATGDQFNEAITLKFLGTAQCGLGDAAKARASWLAAVDILTVLGKDMEIANIQSMIASLAA